MSTDYTLPSLPLGGGEATIVRWLRQPGAALVKGDPLIIVVNDRVEVVFPAPEDGALEALLIAEGEAAAAGAPVARIAQGQPASGRAALVQEPQRISPVARRIAAGSHIDLAAVRGTGPDGRVLKHDVRAALEDRPTTNDQ